MKRRMQLIAVWLGLLASASYAQTQKESSGKWSRQLESVGTADNGDALDWVPLAQPLDESGKDRSGNGRVLTYSQSFPPSGRFGELSKPFDYPYQFQRFPNAAPLRHQGPPPPLKSSASQEPTSQSFFKFEMPFHNEANQPNAPPTLQTGYQIQHSFGGGSLPAPSSLFSPPSLFGQQPQPYSDFQKPLAQALSKPLHQQNFIQDNFPLKSHAKPIPTQASLQSVTPQVFPVDPEPENVFGLNKPAAASSAANTNSQQQQQQQEVQLLYVPYDTLYNQQRQNPNSAGLGASSNFEVNKFNVNAGLPAVNPYQINQFYTQDPSVGSDFFSSGTTTRPSTTTAQPQHIFQSFAQPQAQVQAQPQFTTAKPKPKAHQPPLAMFLLRPNARPTQSDVVAALRNARTISVIDAPTKQTPQIFVGPAGMPIPDGYVKFDLPYLSQLAHSRDLQDVSFFVAPLSYRTPNGFNKILLPEPHVGSIVINRAKDTAAVQELVQPQPVRPQRPTSTRNPFESTTQPQRGIASPAPTRGNKFSYYYVQDGNQQQQQQQQQQQEVNTPKPVKQERHKKKRPQHVAVEQPVYRAPAKTPNPFDTLNQIGGDDFFNTLSTKPSSTSTTSSTSTSTSTTTSTTSTTATPQTLFTYSSRPQVEFPSSNGQLYPQFDTSAQLQPVVQEQLPRLTTRPPTSTTAEEELRMKQYFRQQDAFRQRPQTTNPPFEYAQSPQDYEVPQSSTTQRTKQRVNIYTPVTTSDVGYNVDPQGQPPLNHRPSYNQNEVSVEYEPNPYHVPSELPPLTPDIPGLVNNLQEKDKLPASTTPLSEPEPETRPTRRPLRTRKPAVSKVVTTSSVSYSESESNVKVPSHRLRRPYGSRGTTADNAGEEQSSTQTSTRRPATSRNPLLRNPNRIRYQPTTEERQTLKTKKKHYKGSKNGKPSEDQDLDYQRDVLKQNYPVFKAPSRRPTSPTAIPSSYDVGNTEGPASETQQVYTVTPSNSIDQDEQSVYVPSLLEPMQIAQHYNEFSKDNYGPGYFPNQEDLNPTEAIVRNEVSPIYTTLATTTPSTTTTTTTTTRTTTEAPVTTTTRRSPFIRRNYPRVRTTTTTEAPVTSTTPTTEERPSLRSRLPPRRVVKVRQRQRRPTHPASSSTAAPEEEAEPVTQRQNLRKLSRYNQEQSEQKPQTTTHTPRRRYKQPFQLEGQESQWSPASETGNSNSFKPLNPKYGSKSDTHNFDNEPEIVTAGPTDQPETYEFNVAANLGGSGGAQRTTPTLKEPNLKPEKSFAELLEEVMGKAPEQLATESPTSSTIARLNRRGKWKKSRISGGSDNGENFETAESQNLGPQLYNSLYAGNDQKAELELEKAAVTTTTPMTPATEALTTSSPAELVTTTAAAPTTPAEYEVTTVKAPEATTTMATTLAMSDESATRRMDTAADVDDLDTQPSIFSEVRQQLHDLFAIDESEDQAVTAALAAVGKRRQDYTSIRRTKPVESTTVAATEAPADVLAITTLATPSGGKEDNFHKDLMQHVVYATSTSTKVTSETEICYRGRCIRSEDLPANHKLH
ncbi:mucin-5AC isoform X1 [Drosophila navojoa]|nr:mucin-5AC isoform X1 [Drosophila navojoa]